MAKAGTCLDSYADCSEIGTYGGADFFHIVLLESNIAAMN
jgi:hypothetical protein